jgi:hypothetical protein
MTGFFQRSELWRLGAVRCATTFPFATVLAFAAIISALATALSFAVVFAFTRMFAGLLVKRALGK